MLANLQNQVAGNSKVLYEVCYTRWCQNRIASPGTGHPSIMLPMAFAVSSVKKSPFATGQRSNGQVEEFRLHLSCRLVPRDARHGPELL